MRWKPEFSSYLARLLFEEWNKNNLVQWQADKADVLSYIKQLLAEELQKESALEQEVDKTLNQLEKSHAGQFERYKMYPLLKKKLAEKKGIVL